MAITDKFNQATTNGRPSPAALVGVKAIGASSITVDSTAEWPTDTAVHFIIYEVDANNDKIAGTQCDFKGVVNSATTINELTLRAGTDREYPIGSKVICAPTAAWADDVVEGIVVSLDQDGTLKDNAVTTANITDANVTTAKLADASVTSTKVDFGGAGAGIWWEEIGRTTLGVAGTTITIDSLPARKYLMVIIDVVGAGTVGIAMRFNNDSGNNYTRRSSNNGAVEATQASSGRSSSGAAIDNGESAFGVVEILNVATRTKFLNGKLTSNDAGTAASAANDRNEWTGKWVNTSASINRIDVITDTGANYAIGSEVIVLGHN